MSWEVSTQRKDREFRKINSKVGNILVQGIVVVLIINENNERLVKTF